jgi:hypothetical protein
MLYNALPDTKLNNTYPMGIVWYISPKMEKIRKKGICYRLKNKNL